ncbi:MAG: MATE family efflux transporter [Oscillospiraceae bacterium]
MKQKYDLTQGSILGKLLLVALPIMGTQLLQMAYNLTDMFWLGRLSSDVVAAAGTAGMYLWLSNGLMFIGRMGAEIGVSQNLGRGDRETARSYAQHAVTLGTLLGVLFAVVMVAFNRPLIGFFGVQEAHVCAAAERYLIITALAIPFTFVSGAIAGAFNASGNSRAPFLINAAGLVINMILDPIMIFSFDWGIDGAAIATSLAQIVVFVLSVVAIKWKRTRPLGSFRLFVRMKRDMVVQIFRWSIPIALESMLFTLLSMIVQRVISSFGADAIAVSKVGSQIESMSWLIGGGFASAVTAFVGQNFGAQKWFRIRKGIGISAVAMAVWGVIVSLLLLFMGGTLFSILLPEAHLVPMGANYLRILALCQLPMTLEGVAGGGFRGIGKTLPPSVASITVNALRVGLVYVLSASPMGLDGVWWGVTLGAVARGLWIILWFVYTLSRQPKDDLVVQTAE